jgi:pilus assembly protein CpaB
MRPKTLALMVVAVVCGLVAMMGVQQVLSNQGGSAPELGKILVAKAEILPGQPLDETNVEFKDCPLTAIPEGAVVKPEQYAERTLKVRAFPGDLILEAKLDKKGVRNASSDVPQGMCVAAVALDPTMTGSGLVRPGDRVDVLVTYRTTGSRDVGVGKEVKTVLEAVEIFAIDGVRDAEMIPRPGDPKAIAPKNVSLLVTNKQARLLKLAQDVGVLHLTLRANNDDGRVAAEDRFDPEEAERVAVVQPEREVTPIVEPVAPVEAPNKKKWKIEIIAGSARRVEEVDLPDDEPTSIKPIRGI